jgi:hypothetical protein
LAKAAGKATAARIREYLEGKAEPTAGMGNANAGDTVRSAQDAPIPRDVVTD